MSTRLAPKIAPALVVGRLEPLRRRPLLLVAGGVVALSVAVVLGIILGTVPVPLPDTLAILGHRLLGWQGPRDWAPSAETIVMDLRLPRVLAAMAVGTGLSVAGAAFQGVLRNPLADPYILGTASGAALGASVAVLLPVSFVLFGFGLVHLLAFAGAIGAVALVYRLSRGSSLSSLSGLLLTGYAVASLLAAGLALAMYLSGAGLRQIFFFLLGGFGQASWPQVATGIPLIAVGAVLIALRARSLDALMLGEDAAAHLGVDVRRERLVLLGLGSLVTAAAVAVGGLIGFVGLVVPHVVRLLVGPKARLVVPLAGLFGAVFLVVADLIARIPGELPVGIVTAVIGAPFFLALLRQARGGYEL